MKFCTIQFCYGPNHRMNKKCVWSCLVWCDRSFSAGKTACMCVWVSKRLSPFCSAFSRFSVIHVKVLSRGWARGEKLAGCLSNPLRLISALNQAPLPGTTVLQIQLHFSMQMAWCFLHPVCMSVYEGQFVCVCVIFVWVPAWKNCCCWWVSSLFRINPVLKHIDP